MNPRQRIYDSYEKTNKLIKVNNSYHHFVNLEKIKNRKPEFYPYQKVPYYGGIRKDDFEVKRDNKVVGKIIRSIRDKPPKPKINSLMSAKEMHDDVRKKYQEIVNKRIAQENAFYKKRIKAQKPFVSVKSLDKDYENCKNKYTKRIVSEDINLPLIKSSARLKIYQRSNTEGKIDFSNSDGRISSARKSSQEESNVNRSDNNENDENQEKN